MILSLSFSGVRAPHSAAAAAVGTLCTQTDQENSLWIASSQ